MIENVVLASGQVLFLFLLEGPQVRVGAELAHVVEFEPSEGLVDPDLLESVLFEGAYRHDLALALDSVHDVAQSVLLSESFRWDLLGLEGARSEGDLVRGAGAGDDLSLALASEESLNLVENVRQLELRRVEEGELPGVRLAPEEGALWEVLPALCVLPNGDVIVGFNSYSQEVTVTAQKNPGSSRQGEGS